MGNISISPKPDPRSIKPIQGMALSPIAKKIAQKWKQYGFSESTRNELLRPNYPKLRTTTLPEFNTWDYIMRKTKVLNGRYAGGISCEWLEIETLNLKAIQNQMICLRDLEIVNICLVSYSDLESSRNVELIITKLSRHFQKLQRLSLDFKECSEISNKAMGIIGREISRNLIHLERLKISKLENASQGVRMFLHHVKRHLIGASKKFISGTTDSVLSTFGESLNGNLKNLERISLKFSYCNQITEKEVGLLGTKIKKNLPKLQHLIIKVYWCDQITKAIKQQLKIKFKDVPKISIEVW